MITTMDELMKLVRIKAEEDYKNGVRITIDDLIELTLESIKIQMDGLKKTPLKKYFREAVETSKRELKDLIEIKELQNERARKNRNIPTN